MPLFLSTKIQPDIDLVIWQVREEESFFSKHAQWYEREKTWVDSVHPKKRMEYLASRYILYNYLNPKDRLPIIKDEFGKLHFDYPDQYLSISHSGHYSAFVLGRKELGLDVQVYHPKILKLLSKFLSIEELKFIHSLDEQEEKMKHGILLWSAKESIYKAHGKRGIQFNQQINLSFENNKLAEGELYLPDEIIKYRFSYQLEQDFAWIVSYNDDVGDIILDEFL